MTFLERVGVAKTPNTVELALLEHCLREDLNHNARRAMMVLRPVRLTITNYPEGHSGGLCRWKTTRSGRRRVPDR